MSSFFPHPNYHAFLPVGVAVFPSLSLQSIQHQLPTQSHSSSSSVAATPPPPRQLSATLGSLICKPFPFNRFLQFFNNHTRLLKKEGDGSCWDEASALATLHNKLFSRCSSETFRQVSRIQNKIPIVNSLLKQNRPPFKIW